MGDPYQRSQHAVKRVVLSAGRGGVGDAARGGKRLAGKKEGFCVGGLTDPGLRVPY
jgi:hypothetical protein